MRSRELDFAATKIDAIADQLAAMRDELEAQAAHADDVYASGRARALDLRVAANFPESPGGVAAVENPLARGGHRLKRSTLKKDAALQFLPTNLNWHQLRARRQPDHPPAAARTSNLQPDFNVSSFDASASAVLREPSIRPKISRIDVDVTETFGRDVANRRSIRTQARRRRPPEPRDLEPPRPAPQRARITGSSAAAHGRRARALALDGDVRRGRRARNSKGSDLGRVPLVSADFSTSDHRSERSRRVDAFPGTRARGAPTLKRRSPFPGDVRGHRGAREAPGLPPGQETSDSSSLQHECSARARSGKSSTRRERSQR